MLGRGRPSPLPEYTSESKLAQTFNNHFVTKISDIMNVLADMESSVENLLCHLNSLLAPCETKLYNFTSAAVSEITNILPSVAPIITHIVNVSLSSGVFPTQMKTAIVQPLLKKPTLDKDVLKNFRPVSNLSFLSKVVEKVVAARLIENMTAHNLMDPM